MGAQQHRRVVEANGAGGLSRATWGQESQYLAHLDAATGDALMITEVVPVPSLCSESVVVRSISQALCSFEALRSTLTWSDDGELWQQVHPSIAVELRVEHHQSLAAAEASLASAEDVPVRLNELFEAPINELTAYGVGDQICFLSWTFPHVFVDAGGAAVLARRLQTSLAGPSVEGYFPPSEQPRQRATVEGTARWMERSRRALEYWRNTLRAHHEGDWARRTQPSSATTHRLTLTQSLPTLATVAERYSVPESVVLLGIVGMSIGRMSSHSSLVMKSDFSNRMSASDADSVTCLVQPAYIGFSVDHDHDHGAFLCSLSRAVLQSYRMARYDPGALRRAQRAAESDDHRSYRIPLCFNDMRSRAFTSAAGATTPPAAESVDFLGTDTADGYSDLYVWLKRQAHGVTVRLRTADSRFTMAQGQQILESVPVLLDEIARSR